MELSIWYDRKRKYFFCNFNSFYFGKMLFLDLISYHGWILADLEEMFEWVANLHLYNKDYNLQYMSTFLRLLKAVWERKDRNEAKRLTTKHTSAPLFKRLRDLDLSPVRPLPREGLLSTREGEAASET